MLAAALLVGSVNCLKPVHIDDALYLSIAKQILHSPLDPYGGTINWQQIAEPAYKVSISPPLLSYYFAFVMLLAGESVPILHVSMLVWLLLLGWGVYRLAERWTTMPATVALSVLCAPMLAVGINLMLDVPMLACTCASLEFGLRASEGVRRQVWYTLACGLFAAVAVLIKYPAAVVILLLLTITWQRRKMLLIAAAVVPVLALFSWQAYSRYLYGAAQVGEALGFLDQFHVGLLRQILERSLNILAIVGMTFPVWLIAIFARPRRLAAFLMAAAVAVTAGALAAKHWPWQNAVAFATAAFAGAGLAVRLLVPTRKAEDPARSDWNVYLFLWLWIVGFAAVVILFGPFIAVRSVLPLTVPVAILLARAFPDARRCWQFAIVTSVVLSALLFWTDTRWARSYVFAAEDISGRHQADTIFFLGHWGWQYYAEQKGMIGWDARMTAVPPGSIVVVPLRADKQFLHPAVLQTLEPVDVHTIQTHPLFLTTWNRRTGIRFYGGDFGELPWGFSEEPTEQFTIYRAH